MRGPGQGRGSGGARRRRTGIVGAMTSFVGDVCGRCARGPYNVHVRAADGDWCGCTEVVQGIVLGTVAVRCLRADEAVRQRSAPKHRFVKDRTTRAAWGMLLHCVPHNEVQCHVFCVACSMVDVIYGGVRSGGWGVLLKDCSLIGGGSRWRRLGQGGGGGDTAKLHSGRAASTLSSRGFRSGGYLWKARHS